MTIYKQSLGDTIRHLTEQRMIGYEQPLNEKMRLFMRMEMLMQRFQYHVSADAKPENTVAALQLLLELYNLSVRLDIKSDILKEIDRLGQAVRSLAQQGGGDVAATDAALETLNHHSDAICQQRGQLSQHLKNHMFFNALRQRSSLPGGLNGFDIPLFHYWQEQPLQVRLDDLQEWVAPYQPVNAAICDILAIIRRFGERREEVAKEGFFQSTLELRKPYQMVVVELPDKADCYPEISAGRQRFTLRFVNADMLAERGKQINKDVKFYLTLCAL